MTRRPPPLQCPPPPESLPLEPGSSPVLERYLAEVTARMPGPARARAGIVAELRSGLLDAADAQRSAGLPPDRAAVAAISEFGDAAGIAAGFRAEIAARHARRVVLTLLVTGPLVGLLWIAEAGASHAGAQSGRPWPWAAPAPGLLVAVAVGVRSFRRIFRWNERLTRRAREAAPGSPGSGAPGTARWVPTGSACAWAPGRPCWAARHGEVLGDQRQDVFLLIGEVLPQCVAVRADRRGQRGRGPRRRRGHPAGTYRAASSRVPGHRLVLGFHPQHGLGLQVHPGQQQRPPGRPPRCGDDAGRLVSAKWRAMSRARPVFPAGTARTMRASRVISRRKTRCTTSISRVSGRVVVSVIVMALSLACPWSYRQLAGQLLDRLGVVLVATMAG